MDLSHQALYRLPYSTTDNPKGWLEVTDRCDLSCPGCFRAKLDGHRPLDVLREEIRFFREERKCDSISLAGGEPALHPQILADPDYRPCSYLAGTLNPESRKWLFGIRVGRPGRVLGYFGKHTIELVQVVHRLRTGRYLFFARAQPRPPAFLALGLLDRRLRKALPRALGDAMRRPWHARRPVYTQGVVIVEGPDIAEGGVGNMCDGCPDMTIWKGRLVNSCRLDEFRRWGGLVRVEPTTPATSDPASTFPR